jgi:hypothetical protein
MKNGFVMTQSSCAVDRIVLKILNAGWESIPAGSQVRAPRSIPHGQIGVTTVREVRNIGGDVVRTSGRSPYHATLTGLTPDQISNVPTPTILHPRNSPTLEDGNG